MSNMIHSARAALILSALSVVGTAQTAPVNPQPVVEDSFLDLGSAVGSSQQVGFGSLHPSTTMALRLDGAPAFSSVQCVIGFSVANTPVGIGTLIPAADLTVSLTADAEGNADFETRIPANFGFNRTFYAQWVIDDSSLPGGFGLSNAFRCLTPPTAADGDMLYDDVFAHVTSRAAGDMDSVLINQILADEVALRNDPAQLLELITLQDTMVISALTGPTSSGGPSQAGGAVSGSTSIYVNIFGMKIGSGSVSVGWRRKLNGDRCLNGHTGVGSIPLGSVESCQIGDLWLDPDQCPGISVQCGNFQAKGKQGFRYFLKNTVKSKPDTLCAPCPIQA